MKVIAVLLVLVLGAQVFGLSASATQAQTWGLPSMHITAENHPFHMERATWHDGMVSVSDFSAEGDFEPVDVRLRGRGHSTWWANDAARKRPLRLRFEQEHRSMFGSEYVARDWILLANHFDASLLRNYAALDFARRMGVNMQYVPMAQNFHLYINDEYAGVYLLTDERDVNPGRMNLTFNEDPALSEFFLEFCVRVPNEGGTEGDHFVMVNDRPYDIRFPGSGSQRRAHADHLRGFIYEVSEAIRDGCWCTIERLIDVDSFVDFYIVNELFHNRSLHYSSKFMNITMQDGRQRLAMGPIWDFDHNYGGGPRSLILSRSPLEPYYEPNYWFPNLLQRPYFSEAVTSRWNQLVADGIPQATAARVRHMADTYRADFERNHAHFGIEGLERNTRSFVNWLETRTDFLTAHFNGNMIFSTNWPATWVNWLLFFLGFGWIWMWLWY
ncbi:MAG: CotH kinase family protein [Oscillospiraceae bacterium]|nr:CotH kinase family protein [Oscillospiraceae bacterium]